MFGGSIGYSIGTVADLSDEMRSLRPTTFPVVSKIHVFGITLYFVVAYRKLKCEFITDNKLARLQVPRLLNRFNDLLKV